MYNKYKKEYKGWGLMKNIFKVAIFTFLFLLSCLFTQEVAYAHPGNTDEDGGHTCYTNCEDWGLEYEEYHYHDVVKETSVPFDLETIAVMGMIGFFIFVFWKNRK